ncbi:hypothetical protein ACFLSV_06480 [Bacteroidota bacterium]
MSKSLKSVSGLFVKIGIFAIAMGILEAIVVVYIRKLYYPAGFDFPLKATSPELVHTELIREITTIIMLAIIALIAGKNLLQEFSYFIYCFGIWDIFYYLGLKIFLNWPPSLLTWDVLFLIPVPWIGPVLAPIICSLTMIFLAMCIVYLQEKGYVVRLKFSDWALIIVGGAVIFSTFIWDYTSIIISGGFLSEYWTLVTNKQFQSIVTKYIPAYYNWYLFAVGEILIITAVLLIIKRANEKPKQINI